MIDMIFKKTDIPVRGGELLTHLIKIRGRKCECCQNTEWLNQPINLQVHHIDGDKTNNELNNLQLLCLNCHSYTNNFGSKNKKQKEYITDDELQTALENNSSTGGSGDCLARELTLKPFSQVSDEAVEKIGMTAEDKNGKNLNIDIKSKENYCKKCGIAILPSSTYCIKCLGLVNRTVERPSKEELKQQIRTIPFTRIGAKYGVSDNAIRSWCKAENLPYTKKEIKSYSDEEWKTL